MTRQTKTARERAEAALGVADRLVKRLTAKRDGLREEYEAAEVEFHAAIRRRKYAAANPDLPQTGMDVPEAPEVES